MKSKNDLELTSLEQDIPTTEEDIEALRRARKAGQTDMSSFVRALSRLKIPYEVLRHRGTHEGHDPFEL